MRGQDRKYLAEGGKVNPNTWIGNPGPVPKTSAYAEGGDVDDSDMMDTDMVKAILSRRMGNSRFLAKKKPLVIAQCLMNHVNQIPKL